MFYSFTGLIADPNQKQQQTDRLIWIYTVYNVPLLMTLVTQGWNIYTLFCFCLLDKKGSGRLTFCSLPILVEWFFKFFTVVDRLIDYLPLLIVVELWFRAIKTKGLKPEWFKFKHLNDTP